MEFKYYIFPRIDGRLPKTIQAAKVDPAERAKRPYAVTALLPYRSLDNGLPDKGELHRLGKLEDEIQDALRSFDAIYVGHVNGNGSMRVVFYSREPAPTSITVKAGLLKKATILIESRLDPQWALFELELQPTVVEKHKSRFHQLMQTLSEHGDVSTMTRPVDFAARFSSHDARAAFMSEVNSRGFEPGAQATWEPEPNDFWCEIVKSTPIEPDVITAETVYLEEIAEKYGGEFDGWSCHVTN